MRSVRVFTALAVGAAVVVAALAAVRLLPSLATGGTGAPSPTHIAQPTIPRFVEEADSAGVSHSYDGGFEYYVGGGVATFDCNDDRLPDLYFAGGSSPAALFVNRSTPVGPLTFERHASPTTDTLAVTGAYPLDIDSN